jgi:hypothetical protein
MTSEECVINKVLCFLITARNTDDKTTIIETAVKFYNENDIKLANEVICDILKIKPKWRKSEDKLIKELADIYDHLNQLEKEGMKVKFVAESYKDFPSTQGNELLMSVVDSLRVDILELRDQIKKQENVKNISEERNEDIQIIKEELIEVKKYLRSFIQDTNFALNKKHKKTTVPSAPPLDESPPSPILLEIDGKSDFVDDVTSEHLYLSDRGERKFNYSEILKSNIETKNHVRVSSLENKN